jgi:hypothetical protein
VLQLVEAEFRLYGTAVGLRRTPPCKRPSRERRFAGPPVARGDTAVEDDFSETIECPHCGAEVYEEAERCPHCERYLSQEDAPGRKPWWIIVGALLCLAVALTWAIGC